MFARFTRLPLRRCIHTVSPASRSSNSFNRTAKVVLGASAVTTAYLTWRLNQESNQLALDSHTNASSSKTPQAAPKSARTPPTEPHTLTEPSSFQPDAPNTTSKDVGFVPDSNESGSAPVDTSIVEGKAPEDGEGSDDKPKSGGSSGAYNPETGEINWDCPCLGGMAHGPCGPQFREAFSCFIFSEEEPKGINCVEMFQAMQNCFKEHPEIYADQLSDDDDEEGLANAEKPSDIPPSESPEKVSPETPNKEPSEEKPHSQPAKSTS